MRPPSSGSTSRWASKWTSESGPCFLACACDAGGGGGGEGEGGDGDGGGGEGDGGGGEGGGGEGEGGGEGGGVDKQVETVGVAVPSNARSGDCIIPRSK